MAAVDQTPVPHVKAVIGIPAADDLPVLHLHGPLHRHVRNVHRRRRLIDRRLHALLNNVPGQNRQRRLPIDHNNRLRVRHPRCPPQGRNGQSPRLQNRQELPKDRQEVLRLVRRKGVRGNQPLRQGNRAEDRKDVNRHKPLQSNAQTDVRLPANRLSHRGNRGEDRKNGNQRNPLLSSVPRDVRLRIVSAVRHRRRIVPVREILMLIVGFRQMWIDRDNLRADREATFFEKLNDR